MNSVFHSLAQMTSDYMSSGSNYDLLVKGLLVAYLIVSIAMGVVIVICMASTPGLATADQGTAVFVVIAALLWPLWLTIYLIAKSCAPQKQAAAGTPMTSGIKKPTAFGFPVVIKGIDPSRCTECCHTFAANESRYVFRGQPVCQQCHQSLAVLEA